MERFSCKIFSLFPFIASNLYNLIDFIGLWNLEVFLLFFFIFLINILQFNSLVFCSFRIYFSLFINLWVFKCSNIHRSTCCCMHNNIGGINFFSFFQNSNTSLMSDYIILNLVLNFAILTWLLRLIRCRNPNIILV